METGALLWVAGDERSQHHPGPVTACKGGTQVFQDKALMRHSLMLHKDGLSALRSPSSGPWRLAGGGLLFPEGVDSL